MAAFGTKNVHSTLDNNDMPSLIVLSKQYYKIFFSSESKNPVKTKQKNLCKHYVIMTQPSPKKCPYQIFLEIY